MIDVASRRLLLRLGVATVGLAGLSGTAVAHGLHGAGGAPVAFAVVIGLPIVAGLGGGAIGVRLLGRERAGATGRRVGLLLGLSLAVLGVTFAISALASSRSLGVAGGAAGAVSALVVARGDHSATRGCHADLALGAVSVHRVLEGLAIGALYSTGSVVGLLGAVLLAGHTALETAAVGGMVAAAPGRARAVGAVLLVQAGYAVGAVVGLGLADALPVSARALALAVAGGALLVVGAGEAERSMASGGPAPV